MQQIEVDVSATLVECTFEWPRRLVVGGYGTLLNVLKKVYVQLRASYINARVRSRLWARIVPRQS